MGEDWIPYAKRDKLSFPLMLGIAASSICPSMIWSAIMGLYFGLAFKLGITGTLNTVVLLLGSLIGFIVTPIVGVISDGTTLKWGRRRIYMVVGSLVLLIAYILVIFCDKIVKNPSGVKGLFIFGILLANTGTNILQGPARYLISDVCPPTQQVLMGSIGAIYTGIGGLFNNLIGALALYKYTSLTQEQFILVCSIVVITVSTFISCIVAKEEQLTEKPKTSNPFAGIVVAFKDMTKPRLILCMVSFVMNIAGYTYALQLNTFMGVEIYHGNPFAPPSSDEYRKYDEGASWAMICQVVAAATQFVYSFFQTKACDLLGLKMVFCLTNVFLSTMYLLFFFVRNKIVFLVMNIPYGIGQVGSFALANIAMSLICPPEKLGANFSLLNCFNTIGQQIANFGFITGLSKVWPNKPGHIIGISCVPGYLAAALSFLLIIPKASDIANYDDEAEDSESESDRPDSI